MSKKVILVRHAKKEGEFISPAAIRSIIKKGIPVLNKATEDLIPFADHVYVHMGSEIPRTAQTMMAYLNYALEHQGAISDIFPPDGRLGSKELFALMAADARVVEEQKSAGWPAALRHHNPALLEAIKKDGMNAIIESFSAMANKSYLMMIGHTPIIEIISSGFDSSFDVSSPLPELAGVIISQDGEKYSVTRL